MKSYILSIIIYCCPLLFFSCIKDDTSIYALVDKDRDGNYTIKWEIYPEKDDAMLEIYASNNDSIFPNKPIKTVEANRFIDVVENADSLGYRFFKLKVGKTYSPVIALKFYRFNEIQNFRDMGGYITNDGKSIKWGKIFRSGDFSNVSDQDMDRLKALNLKTIIDLRSEYKQSTKQDCFETPYHYGLYISGMYNDSIFDKVLINRFLKGDALVYTQDAYRSIILNHADQYKAFFNYLVDEHNYPIAYHCTLGKDQTGIASFFLLKALDVSTETAEEDYMLSNRGINRRKIIEDASKLTEGQQQIFTTLTNTDISYLRYALACVRKQEGSIDDFMIKKLDLTQEKRKKLRKILLYDEE